MRPPRYNPSPRPSSTSSCQSIQSNTSTRLAARGPRRGDDICVGEELKIAITTAVERFRLSEEHKGIKHVKINCLFVIILPIQNLNHKLYLVSKEFWKKYLK